MGPGRGRGELTAGALDVASGTFEIPTRLDLGLRTGFYRPLDPTAQRMVLAHRSGDGTDLVLHDAWSGAPLASLRSSPAEGLTRVLFLADGRIVFDGSEAGAARLQLVDREGRHVAYHDLGSARGVVPVSEIAPGRVVVRLRLREEWDLPGSADRQAAVVDLATGSVVRLDAGWLPARSVAWTWWRGQPPKPGSLASRLLLNPEGGLEVFEPDTGATRHLLGPG